MFLITGITGKVGGAAARNLLAAGKQVRALVRDIQKAAEWKDQGVELLQGEWEDVDTLTRALEGVEGAYLMMPPTQTPSKGFPEAKSLAAGYAKALEAAQPKKVVALSSIGSEKDSGLGLITSTHLLEQALAPMTFPVAFVRAGGFFENFLYGLQTGQGGILPVMYLPTDRPVPMIATEDIGAQVAKLLMEDFKGHRIVELGTPITPEAVAAALGEVLGRDVQAAGVPREAWTESLEHMGLPAGNTWAYEEMLDGFNSNWIHFGIEGTEPVAGTTSAKQVFTTAKDSSQN